MAQIPILSGIYTDSAGKFRTSYPRNYVPVTNNTGISAGYLDPGEGIVERSTGPGSGRGGINWNGTEYRVMGTKLCSVAKSGAITVLGDVEGTGQVRMDYSFDRLAIASNGKLWYWNGTVLSQVTDPDLGTVLDVQWIDSYFMTTDGSALVVTELDDPMQVNPFKYGSSEGDPDPIVTVRKLKREAYAVNRYSIEILSNVGGDNFPFARAPGAFFAKGAIGRDMCAMYMESLVMVGGGRNEAPSVWFMTGGSMTEIATREICQILQNYSELELSQSVMEVRTGTAQQLLYIHLPDRTLVYDAEATKTLQRHVWCTLDSGLYTPKTYRARNFVWIHDRWTCEDPTTEKLGELTVDLSTHFGARIGWEFGTLVLYNAGLGGIIHQLELVCLPGRVPLGADPRIWTQYSTDGTTWSQEKQVHVGQQGQRDNRLTWRMQGRMRNMRMQRFRGQSDAHVCIARLEATVEQLYG